MNWLEWSLDLVVWGVVLVASLADMALIDATVGLTCMWSVPVLRLVLYAGLSAFVRVLAAASLDRFNPYRRRAPWEPRNWWQGWASPQAPSPKSQVPIPNSRPEAGSRQ